jgi:hypothetical protein
MFVNLPFLVCLALAPAAAHDSALARLGVDAWHARGFRGEGMTVAVLDSGFRGYRNHLGHELPQRVRIKSFRRDGNLEAKDDTHGLCCAETVHRLAPAVELVFANWEPDCPDAFLEAVRWCRQQGAAIITCSMIMPGWSDGHGGGDVHRQLEQALGNALFFASAGNLALRHWSGRFNGDGQSWHQWRSDSVANEIKPWGTQPVSVEVIGPPGSEYRLTVVDDRDTPAGMEQPLTAAGVHGSAIRFRPELGRAYRARVELASGPGGEFRLIALGAELEIATKDGCMVFPGDGRAILTVGAVSLDGNRLETSSLGDAGETRHVVKPDCVATVPFSSKVRGGPFGGTSAAAPQAAALAALLWSRERQARPGAIANRLRRNCTDLGPPGPDVETGFGRINLPAP